MGGFRYIFWDSFFDFGNFNIRYIFIIRIFYILVPEINKNLEKWIIEVIKPILRNVLNIIRSINSNINDELLS